MPCLQCGECCQKIAFNLKPRRLVYSDEHDGYLFRFEPSQRFQELLDAHGIEKDVLWVVVKTDQTPEELATLAQAVTQLPRLRLRGLMTIPEPSDDPLAQRAPLARLRQLREALPADLDTLSMGMSHDLEAAIAEGATWVRIGTALFGARDYGQPSNS